MPFLWLFFSGSFVRLGTGRSFSPPKKPKSGPLGSRRRRLVPGSLRRFLHFDLKQGVTNVKVWYKQISEYIYSCQKIIEYDTNIYLYWKIFKNIQILVTPWSKSVLKSIKKFPNFSPPRKQKIEEKTAGPLGHGPLCNPSLLLSTWQPRPTCPTVNCTVRCLIIRFSVTLPSKR